MEEKPIPTKESFFAAFKKLQSIGYRRMTVEEITEQIRGKETVSIAPRKGKPYGFRRKYVLELNTYRVEVNTNYSDAIGGPVPKGHMSVFLKDSLWKDTLTSFDIQVTEAGLDKLVEYASAFADIVLHWPVDPECGNRLALCRVKGVMHIRHFTCKTRRPYHQHKMRRVEVYFTDIPDISLQTKTFLDTEFDRNAYYTEWQKRNGKNPTPLRVLRAQKVQKKEKAP